MANESPNIADQVQERVKLDRKGNVETIRAHGETINKLQDLRDLIDEAMRALQEVEHLRLQARYWREKYNGSVMESIHHSETMSAAIIKAAIKLSGKDEGEAR